MAGSGLSIARKTQRNTLAGFATRCGAFAIEGLPMSSRKGVESAAYYVTTMARASIRAGSGGDSVLSQVGRSQKIGGQRFYSGGGGARVGAAYNVKGTKNPTALVYATGPLHLLDNPTVPHRIGSKVSKGRKGSSQREAFYNAIFGGQGGYRNAVPLRTPYGPRYSVQHPGTRGKRTFFRAVSKAAPMTGRYFQGGVRDVMRRYFG